jgi:predicted metal-binding membrane protein
MHMPPATSFGDAAEFVGMWLTMMAPMMLPSLMPLLWRYHRSVPAASVLARHGLTALVGVGYFAVWALLAVVIYAGAAALAGLETRGEWLRLQSGLIGAALLLAGAVQLSSWKARQLARCRGESVCIPGPTARRAWRHGLELGVQCALSCGNLMLALLALGMMNPVAMAAVTLAVTAERLAPAPRPIARVAGVAIAAVGVLTMAAS